MVERIGGHLLGTKHSSCPRQTDRAESRTVGSKQAPQVPALYQVLETEKDSVFVYRFVVFVCFYFGEFGGFLSLFLFLPS